MYTVKFVCVSQVGSVQTGIDDPFEPGVYRTAANIHNPQRTSVTIRKKAVTARSEDLQRGIISDWVIESLEPNQALDIECNDINGLLGGFQPVGDGFVVIETVDELDVIAVYTQIFLEERAGALLHEHSHLEIWDKITLTVSFP